MRLTNIELMFGGDGKEHQSDQEHQTDRSSGSLDQQIARKEGTDAERSICEYGVMVARRMKPVIYGLRSLWLVLTAVLLLVLSASALASPTNPFSLQGSQNIELAAPETTRVEPLVDSARYAGLEIAIESARAIPAEPPARPIVVVDIVVANSIRQQVRLPGRMVSLHDVETKLASLDRFEFAPSKDKILLEPGEELRVAAVFKLAPYSTFAVEDLSLQVSEPGRWPTVLPLDGSAPLETDIPQPDLVVPEETVIVSDREISNISVESTLDYGTYRAPSGQYLAVFTVESVPVSANKNASASEPGDVVSSLEGRDTWTLSIDGESRNASRVTKSKARDTATVTYDVVFAYPIDSAELNLTIGDQDQVAVAQLSPSN